MDYSSIRTELAGVAVLEIVGADAEGGPVVRIPPEDENRSVRVAWMREEPDWAMCGGLRAVVAFPEGEGPVLLGLLDPPPAQEGLPEKVHIESEEEIVIRCGKSRIAMRADGRIEIRGGHLISRSSGPNKIKGGSVQLN